MSAISSSLGASQSTVQATGTDGFNDLSSEEFIQILFTELSNQDPFEPNDSQALLDQLSSIRDIQSDIELTDKLDALVTQNQLATSGALLGAYVAGRTEGGQEVEGLVVSVSSTSDGPVLRLDNNFRVPFESVRELTNPAFLAPIDDEG